MVVMKKCDHPRCGQTGVGHFTIRGVRVSCPTCQGTGLVGEQSLPEGTRIEVQPKQRRYRARSLTSTVDGDSMFLPETEKGTKP